MGDQSSTAHCLNKILQYLDKSEFELSEEDSDNDPTYRQDIYSTESSSGTDDDTEINILQAFSIPSSLTTTTNTIRAGRARSRVTSRGRKSTSRVLRVGPTVKPTSPPVVATDDWEGNKFEPKIHPMTSLKDLVDKNYSGCELNQFFEEYIDDNILTNIVYASNQTYVQNKGKSLGLTLQELKIFIGISLLMSAINYPRIELCWNDKWKLKIISSAMTLDRYNIIRTGLKVVYDNDISCEKRLNKMWKVLPLFNKILRGCHLQQRSEHIFIDEMIIPFKGSCALQRYRPKKPNPVGLKIFVAANSDGVILDMVIYQDEDTFKQYLSQGFSLGESAVLKLTETLTPGHYLYFDKYFSSVKLLNELITRGFNCTGRIMRSRLPKNCVFTDDKEFMKKPRGSTEVRYSADGKIAITKWLDNKPILLISSCFSDTDVDDTCMRWNKYLREYQTVRRAEVVQKYYAHMRSVDLSNKMIAVYPKKSHIKKWTIAFTFHMITVAVTNSWIAYRNYKLSDSNHSHKIEKLRAFKMNLGEILITKNRPRAEFDEYLLKLARVQHKKPRIENNPIPALMKGMHLPEYTDMEMSCRKAGCKMKSMVKCRCCEFYFCVETDRNCFMMYHTNY